MLGICPSVQSFTVFGSWIDFKALVRLDSAYCNHIDRLAFESLLSSKQFIFRSPVALHDQLITWLSNKQVKASNIVFGANCTADLLTAFFLRWGSFVHSVNIGPQHSHEMFLAAMHCRNLHIVRFKNLSFGSVIKELLWCNPNISEIWLENMLSSVTTHFEDVPLSKLHTLSIVNSACNKAFPLLATCTSTTLQKLQLGSFVDVPVLLNVVRLTPELKSLSLKDVQLSSEVLTEVCSTRPTLLHLDVSGNRTLNSDGALGMFQKLTLLRSISLHRCTAVSDRTINNLAILCGPTLEVAHINVNDCDDKRTVDRLTTFGTICTQLRVLNIHNKKVLCLAGGTFELLHNLPALHTLVVESTGIICASSRRFLEVSRPNLKIVVADAEKHTYNVLSMPL